MRCVGGRVGFVGVRVRCVGVGSYRAKIVRNTPWLAIGTLPYKHPYDSNASKLTQLSNGTGNETGYK